MKVPEHAHPLVRTLYREAKHRQMPLVRLCALAGVNRETVRAWRTKANPQLHNLEACFNVLGMTLQPVRLEDQ